MFRITAETCRAFSFAEVLILAAMNAESIRLRSDDTARTETVAMHRGYPLVSHSLAGIALAA